MLRTISIFSVLLLVGCHGSLIEVEGDDNNMAEAPQETDNPLAPQELAEPGDSAPNAPELNDTEPGDIPIPIDTDPNPTYDLLGVTGADLMPPTKQATYNAIAQEYETSRSLTSADLQEDYNAYPTGELDYDPVDALNMNLIQSSELALGTEAMTALENNGFVITTGHSFPHFFSGYESIYEQDLPVYISADSILDALHRSYDSILQDVETGFIVGDLETILEHMYNGLGGGSMDEQTCRDLDLYLTVARSLLLDELLVPTHGADTDEVAALVNGALAAQGMSQVFLFGTSRTLDFSQFKPRGHYEDHYILSPYFRAMMWLGRIDFRLVETAPDGGQQVNRAQLAATIEIGSLLADEMARWDRVNRALELFVGKSDNMTPTQVSDLLGALGISSASELASLSDDAIKVAILGSGIGAQQISSHIMMNGIGTGTLPLNASFLLFGQRYVVDSHVFSNLVYDRVMEGNAMRMMPNPLDVAFAALRNDQAARLLQEELDEYGYAPDLHLMRHMVEAYDDSFWNGSLYNLWLRVLQALSPQEDAGLPSFATTPDWGRRILNTQLGSWSQLRHDTILYAKQSYTGGYTCEFPDAYVEPYPQFYNALVVFADKGQEVVDLFGVDGSTWLASRIGSYFTDLAFVGEILGEMAQAQRSGTPFNAAQMAFVNDMVYTHVEYVGCVAETSPRGWYTRLFYNQNDVKEHDPIIADVHTQATDEYGAVVGNVLHVATGNPRLMVVTVNNCDGPRAYAGLVFAYHELIKGGFTRMTDSEWVSELFYTYPPAQPPAEVPWMQDLIHP